MDIRAAQREDVSKILYFIKALASYEKLENEVVATEEELTKNLFDYPYAKVIFVMDKDKEVGFCLYFTNFSTFLGKPGIHIEDLFVLPQYRGKGYGKAMIRHVCQEAANSHFGRIEWECLDWNKDSIQIYLHHGAQPKTDWTIYRFTEDTLKKIAGEQNEDSF